MNRKFGITVVAGLLTLGTTMVWAQGPGAMREMPRRGGGEFGMTGGLRDPNVRSKLGITDEQYSKLQSAFFNATKARIKDQADLKIKRLELANLMMADKVDRTQVNAKINEIAALQSSLLRNRIETQIVVKETLTPDQLAKLHEWRQSQMREHMQERMRGRMLERGQGRGMGPGPNAPRPPQPQQPPAPPNQGDGGQLQ